MHLFELTRRLVDIDSTTGREAEAARFVADYLGTQAGAQAATQARTDGAEIFLEEAAPGRPNVFVQWGTPRVVMSTHLDTVPPFFPSSEDPVTIRGRGSCDAKGIVAAMIKAAEALRAEGLNDFGLLFLVGEERDSIGAQYANRHPRGSQFLINGEPTQNLLAVGSKGALRVVLTARGRMAHSAYPNLGESAIDKLVEALHRISKIAWPTDRVLGASTSNVGTIAGGRAPNVIPDEARAELLIRLVGDSVQVKAAVNAACAGLVDVDYVLELPAMLLETLEGMTTTVVAFTTDIPSLTAWGKPFLLGPGSIMVAHTESEVVGKDALQLAVEQYCSMTKRLLSL